MGMAASQPQSAAAPQVAVKKKGRPRSEHSWAADRQRTDVKRGQFTKQEKETLRAAVRQYAAFWISRGLFLGQSFLQLGSGPPFGRASIAGLTQRGQSRANQSNSA